jgi:hypothetical protein
MKQVSRINVFVASFSEIGDSLGQWRGYCSEGCGFSVGFNSMLLKHLALRQGFSVRACIYDDQTQAKVLNDLINDTLRKIVNDPMATDSQEVPYVTELDRFREKFVQIAPTLKDSCFKDEKEWRLISGPISVDDPRLKMRAGKSMLIPYVPIILSPEQSPFPAEEIIVGPTPHTDLATSSLCSYLSNKCLSKWKVRSSTVPYRDW